MARWRAESLERLPELRDVITSADNVMAMWIELQMAFEKAYRADPRDESLIGRIYSFADWCMQAPRVADAGHDPMTAVTVAFYEDIPKCKAAREDMPRWFRYEEIVANRPVFAYHLDGDEYKALVTHMAKNQHRYRPRAVAEP